MRLRPTRRGVGMTVLGSALTVFGVAVGSVDLVMLGLVPVLAVLGGVVYLTVGSPRRWAETAVTRTVHPTPVFSGTTAEVTVRVTGRLADVLSLREQAASALSDSRPLRARVTRQPQSALLRYRIHPRDRGRWTVGPLTVERQDLFGTMRVSGPLGDSHQVVVWPEVVELPMLPVLHQAAPDQATPGAHAPGADDNQLREYRVGDDLRRVHWRSSARRPNLLVRVAENAGIRPATVLLDQGTSNPALEWSITLAASVALTLHAAGHPTRLIASAGTGGPDRPAADRAELLDATIDLTGHSDSTVATCSILHQIRQLEGSDGGSGLVVAVLEPLGNEALTALTHLSATRPCWAVVRGEGRAARETCERLERVGWHTVQADVGASVKSVWVRLGVRQ